MPDNPVWDASLSTMWARKNFLALEDFFAAAHKLGFARVELNHQVDSTMLAGIDLTRYAFSSIHEPCPADIPTEQLKARDWLISATDEACRQQGLKSIRRSIDLARQLGAPVVVIHAGAIPADADLEVRLRRLSKTGQRQSEAYAAICKQMIRLRLERAAPRIAAVKRSLSDLLDYAGRAGICLGLENRFHYLDIPSLDEMGTLLDLAGSDQGAPNRLGFIYDVGHAQALDRLGFYPHEEWLKAYAARIIGAHLHDTIGADDHYAAGLGEVDFSRVAACLPTGAFRTCEFNHYNTPQQVRAGLMFLAEQGCIRHL